MKKLAFIVLVCTLAGPPALADLFNFTVSSARTTFDGGTAFSSSLTNLSMVNVTREEAPTGSAVIMPMSAAGGFSLTMTLSTIDNTNYTADGAGAFTLTDIAGHTLTGHLVGSWNRPGSWDAFSGTLSNVTFTPAGGNFVGNLGSVSMNFSFAQPWNGSIIELTAYAPWFGAGTSFDQGGGIVGATVVPAPLAVLLGLLGLGTAGLKLRKLV